MCRDRVTLERTTRSKRSLTLVRRTGHVTMAQRRRAGRVIAELHLGVVELFLVIAELRVVAELARPADQT